MKLTKFQQNELETLQWFMQNSVRHIPITENDIKKYFEWSEQGKHRDDIKDSHFTDGFNALVSAKQWRGRHAEMYEQGILDQSVPYVVLISAETPRPVVDFLKKEMFQGYDAKVIERIYQRNCG